MQLWPSYHQLENLCFWVRLEAWAACWGALTGVGSAWAAGQLCARLGAGMGAMAAQMCVCSACIRHPLDKWLVILWQHPVLYASVQHLNVPALA